MNDILPGIRARRKAKNMTLDDLGAELGLTGVAVGMWERGETLPAADRLPRLAEVLGCTVDELYQDSTGEGATKP